MKQLNKVQSTLFLIGGMLMVIGAGSYVFMWHQRVVCWLFMLGACLFAAMQMSQTYEGRSLTIKRLKRIMSAADMFFVLSGLLMVDNANALLLPYFHSYTRYLELVYNKWVLLLLVAAVLEIYTMHRLGSELRKEENSTPAAQ